jgi:hypothetical protein
MKSKSILFSCSFHSVGFYFLYFHSPRSPPFSPSSSISVVDYFYVCIRKTLSLCACLLIFLLPLHIVLWDIQFNSNKEKTEKNHLDMKQNCLFMYLQTLIPLTHPRQIPTTPKHIYKYFPKQTQQKIN